jgi:hypothetical protein
MNPQKSPEITVQTLLALRKEEDAVRLITERLRVKEMGPADHIRTKHEVKAFVESGEQTLAEALVKRASERRDLNQMQTIAHTERRGQSVSQ